MPAKPRYDKKRINVRLDDRSLQALEALMKLTGKDESKIVRAALIYYEKNPQLLGGDLSDKTDYSKENNDKAAPNKRLVSAQRKGRIPYER